MRRLDITVYAEDGAVPLIEGGPVSRVHAQQLLPPVAQGDEIAAAALLGRELTRASH